MEYKANYQSPKEQPEINKTPEIEISDREKHYFSRLDILGNRSLDALKKISEKLSTQTTSTNIEFLKNELIDLSAQQIELLTIISESLHKDTIDVETHVRNTSAEKLRKQLYELIKPEQEGSLDNSKIEIKQLPGAMALYITDAKYFETLFPQATDVLGLYVRENTINKANPLNGRLLVVHDIEGKINPSPQEALEHEYLHFLTNIYIQKLEIQPYISKKHTELLSKKHQLTEEIPKLEEELIYEDDLDEIEFIHNDIQRKKLQIRKLERQINQNIEQSEFLNSKKAQQLFGLMRDELAAHALIDILVTTTKPLVSAGQNFETELSKISSISDREKLQTQWEVLRKKLQACKENFIEATELTTIFLTSQSFLQMAKRIELLLKSKKK